MAIIITLADLVLEEGETHLSSTYEVSKDINFDPDQQIAYVEEDEHAKFVKVFEVELLPGEVYYARSRIITNFGLSKWSNTASIEVVDARDDVHISLFIPINLPPPDIRLDYDLDKVPPTLFNVRLDPGDIKTRNNIIASSYIIKDTEGKVVFKDLVDRDNVKKKLVYANLEANKTYTIYGQQQTSSNDVSEVAGKSFYVSYNKNYTFKQVSVDDDRTVTVDMNRSNSFQQGKIIIYSDEGTPIVSDDDNGSSVQLELGEIATRFIIVGAIETTIDNVVKEPTYSILDLSTTMCTLPHPLPYSFGCEQTRKVESLPHALPYSFTLN